MVVDSADPRAANGGCHRHIHCQLGHRVVALSVRVIHEQRSVAAEAFTWRNDILEPNEANKSAGPALLKWPPA